MVNPMAAGSMGVGPEALGQIDPITLQPTSGGMQGGMQGGMMSGQGSIDPITGEFVPDPMAGGSLMTGGTTTAWTSPLGNDQLYLQQQRRPIPYIDEKYLRDPWNQPIRYDHSLLYPQGYGGFNANGAERPAIWSAGPDGTDGTPDDILQWNVEEANDNIAQRLQLRQGQMTSPFVGPGDGFGPNDPMNPNPMFPMDPNNPMGTGPMGTGPMGTGPMGTGPMGTGPMGTGPMGTGPMGTGPMGTGPAGTGPMGTGPMGTGPMGTGPMGTGPMGTGPAGTGPMGTGPMGTGPMGQ